MLIKISKKTPFLLIKKALLLIGEYKPEKTLLIVRGDCYAVSTAIVIAYWHFEPSYYRMKPAGGV